MSFYQLMVSYLRRVSVRRALAARFLTAGCLVAGFWVAVCPVARAINIELDYTYDSSGFFGSGNPDGAAAGSEARAALEAAATYFSDILTDTFSAIDTPAPFSSNTFGGIATWSWNLNFGHPGTGATVTLTDPSIAVDEYRIYAGARNISGTTLGIGGPGGFGWSTGGNGGFFTQSEINQINQITADFEEDVEDREETSGFARWGGAITFDQDSSTNWHYNHNIAPSFGENDFFSVAIHEMGHALGLGASDNWNNWISGTNYTGPQAVAEYGGQVPLACSPGCGHWAENTQSVVFGTSISQEAAMDPDVTKGDRKLFTALDAAALSDIGWSVVPPTPTYDSADYDTDGDVDGADLSIMVNWYGTNANGDADGDNDTDGNDWLTWQQQYTGSLPLLANVPEPTGVSLIVVALAIASCRRRLANRCRC
ncbi:MAG: matrixin family metalloprotease [Bythopirellula sp.]